MKHYDVVGLGFSTLDVLGSVDEFPEVGTLVESPMFVEEGGGPAATAIVALARLGVSTTLISALGGDDRGATIKRQLQREGVDVEYLLMRDGQVSPLSFILVDGQSGERTIIYSWGTVEKMKVEEVPLEVVARAKVLHVDGFHVKAQLYAANYAVEKRIPVVLDAGVMFEGIDELVRCSDHVVSSHAFATELTGEQDAEKAAKKLYKMYGHTSIVTAGENGGFCVSNEEEFAYPAFPVDVVDTTGAGDVFHGAYVYGVLQRWPLKKTVNFSRIVAALKCRHIGGRRAIPTLIEAMDTMEKVGAVDW